MKLSQFKFDLPVDQIAYHPPKYRDESRMMVVHRDSGKIEHKNFKDILEYFDDQDTMVINNTKVFPARLYGVKEKTGAEIEVFLLRELNYESRLWDVLVNPARKIRIGNKLYFGADQSLVAEVIDNTTSRGRTLRFLYDGAYSDFKKHIKSLGEPPLPKIINRPIEEKDRERYQTIFAKHEGAVAAPTAGMHFSREIKKRFEIKGVNFAELTLHAGLGNFRKVDVEDLSKHNMDSEQMIIEKSTADIINETKKKGKRICSVGTTTMKALESGVSITGYMKPFNGWINKFIFPPHEFNVAYSMLTNFHLPQSTMMMMVAAFTGYDLLMEAYKTAVKEGYHFFTYGDAMLIL